MALWLPVPKKVEQETQYGGYDYDFMEEVPEQLVCSAICTKVLRDPHLTACCGQHFCNSCLQHWFKRQGKQVCPHCREENFSHIPDKPVKRKIGQLKIHCTNHKAGCDWVGKLSTLQFHLDSNSGCGYVEVSCTNHCTERDKSSRSYCAQLVIVKMKRKDLANHLAQQCPLRKYTCQHCGKEDTCQTITETHYNECPNYPLDCPNKCGTRGIKRAKMNHHRSTCPHELIECQFKEAGCQVKVLRKDVDNHMKTSQQQHLLTLMGAFKETNADLDSLKQVIATDVKILRQSSQREPSDLALASIESQLEMRSFRLVANGPPLTIRMTNFSHYQQSGKVWHSPPFYYGDGYKMQLAVYANGIGAGAGTHVSISLLRMKGKYDDQLQWTDDYAYVYDMSVKIATQKPTPKLQVLAVIFRIIRRNRIIDVKNVREEGREERFADLLTLKQPILLNDSIVLQVSIQPVVRHRPLLTLCDYCGEMLCFGHCMDAP